MTSTIRVRLEAIASRLEALFLNERYLGIKAVADP